MRTVARDRGGEQNASSAWWTYRTPDAIDIDVYPVVVVVALASSIAIRELLRFRFCDILRNNRGCLKKFQHI